MAKIAPYSPLRTFAFNDNVVPNGLHPGYLQKRYFAQNATSVGYVDGTAGEFVPVTFNNGQRDTLYANKVNPNSNREEA